MLSSKQGVATVLFQLTLEFSESDYTTLSGWILSSVIFAEHSIIHQAGQDASTVHFRSGCHCTFRNISIFSGSKTSSYATSGKSNVLFSYTLLPADLASLYLSKWVCPQQVQDVLPSKLLLSCRKALEHRPVQVSMPALLPLSQGQSLEQGMV